MTTGYSRPNSARTVASAASMAALFSGLVKSVSGSLMNSLSIFPPRRPVTLRGAAGMYSKTLAIAIATMLLLASCSITLPWAREPVGEEVNLSFVIRNNLLFLPSATVHGRPGQFLFAAADARTAMNQAASARKELDEQKATFEQMRAERDAAKAFLDTERTHAARLQGELNLAREQIAQLRVRGTPPPQYAQPTTVQPTNIRVAPGQRGRAVGAGAPAN